MASNYDLLTNDAFMAAARLRLAASQGRFPKHLMSRFGAGGEVFNQIRTFLEGKGGRGGVYIARDKHGKVYGVSLVVLRQASVGHEAPAKEFIRESGGVDEFMAKLWSRNSAGGLYRRAKTQYRVRKVHQQTAKPLVIDRLDPDTGLPMNPDFVFEDDGDQATLGTVNF